MSTFGQAKPREKRVGRPPSHVNPEEVMALRDTGFSRRAIGRRRCARRARPAASSWKRPEGVLKRPQTSTGQFQARTRGAPVMDAEPRNRLPIPQETWLVSLYDFGSSRESSAFWAIGSGHEPELQGTGSPHRVERRGRFPRRGGPCTWPALSGVPCCSQSLSADVTASSWARPSSSPGHATGRRTERRSSHRLADANGRAVIGLGPRLPDPAPVAPERGPARDR
jgi:hypothetical protein